jgi:hypothetical protein
VKVCVQIMSGKGDLLGHHGLSQRQGSTDQSCVLLGAHALASTTALQVKNVKLDGAAAGERLVVAGSSAG